MQPGYPTTSQPAMQPVQVRIEKVRTPTATYAIMGFTLVVFLIQYAIWPTITDLADKSNLWIYNGQFYRLITPVFLHGSLQHFLLNMYALWAIGAGLERAMGHGRFVLLYFLSAFAGNVMSFLLLAAPSLGASTAIFGILAAEGVFLYQNRNVIKNSRAMLQNIIFVAAINLVFGFTSGFVDNWGHIGGMLGGLIFAWFAGPKIRLIEGAYPQRFDDVRTTNDVIIATILVLGIFGSLAAAKIVFIPPPVS
jgi:rhomboid protease GluP